MVDLGSSTGTFLKMGEKRVLLNKHKFLMGTEVELQVMGVNNNRSTSYDNIYFYHCLLSEIDRGTQVHGLSPEERERLNSVHRTRGKYSLK